MGCDIHLFVEKKSSNGIWNFCCGERKWWTNQKPPMASGCYAERNYNLFGALANVRWATGENKEPLGFPEDASSSVKLRYERWGCDAHSASYMSLVEAEPLFLKYYEEPYGYEGLLINNFKDPNNKTTEEVELFKMTYGVDPKYGIWFGGVDEKCIEDYRIVFWFDN